MKKRRALRAVVTIQAAHVPSSTSLNPFVRILVMVPKGKNIVTVPTDCTTHVQEGTINPVWNQTFLVPVRRASDVLVFNVREREGSSSVPRLRRISTSSRNQQQAGDSGGQRYISGLSCAGLGGMSPMAEPPHSSSGAVSSTTSSAAMPNSLEVGTEEEGRNIAVCLLPIEMVPGDGSVVRRRLELFEDPDGTSGVGSLYVAARLEEFEVDQWEKSDLDEDHLISKYHRSRLSAFEDRFIGLGEMAAFLYEEGYSQDRDANWDRAVTILAEQLAYQIYETTGDKMDRANFLAAKAQIERDKGLWDGM